MNNFLKFNLLNLIKGSIEKISIDEIPEGHCTICICPLIEISENECITEIDKDSELTIEKNTNKQNEDEKDYKLGPENVTIIDHEPATEDANEKTPDKSIKAFTYFYKCLCNNYLHTWCLASYFYNFWRNEKNFSENQNTGPECPNCRVSIKYSDYVQSIINIIVSSMNNPLNLEFKILFLVSSIKFNSYKEFIYFLIKAKLSEETLSEIIKVYRKIYLRLNEEKISEMANRAIGWALCIDGKTLDNDRLINNPTDEFYLSLDTLIDKTNEFEFKEWLSDQNDGVALKFFENFIVIHKEHQTNVFLNYLIDSIKSFRFFKPHLFDNMLQKLEMRNSSLFEKIVQFFMQKKTLNPLVLSDKSNEFVNKIKEAIEITKKSIYFEFLMKIRQKSEEEYQTIWRLKLNENLADEYCKVLCDQISRIIDREPHGYETIIIVHINPLFLSYSGFKIIFDLILKGLISNPDKFFSISEQIKEFLPKNSVFFLRYFFENLNYFFILKETPNAIGLFFEMNSFPIYENFEELIFELEKTPEEYYDFFSNFFNVFVEKTMISGSVQNVGIHKLCLAFNFIIVIGLNNKKLSDYLLHNFLIDVYFEEKQNIRFQFDNWIEEATNESAIELFDNFGKKIQFDDKNLHLFFIQTILKTIDYKSPNLEENRFIAQKIYNILKLYTFSYGILINIMSISDRNNIFISDIAILIEESFNDSMIDKDQLFELFKEIISSECFVSALETDKEDFIRIFYRLMNFNIFTFEEVSKFIEISFKKNVFYTVIIDIVLLKIILYSNSLEHFIKYCDFLYKIFTLNKDNGFRKLFIHFLSTATYIFKEKNRLGVLIPFHQTHHDSLDILVAYLDNFIIKSDEEIKFIYRILIECKKKITYKELVEILQKFFFTIRSDRCKFNDKKKQDLIHELQGKAKKWLKTTKP